ncbi:predicted protein [Plenodomus lingam JN3]|uniref:Predicted protein n=1 Tax=Leptosphaeria maculans (strain JN3 / isolate v23.1.3 / race Av1-4-5-6-7-8) TaxID=985895 RepID=E4ZSL0_LEPMJ|nr:predicted protein [Plenodomus lingam JN3]CBX94390.1 predicted protein [Plenodomus lingam JN3]
MSLATPSPQPQSSYTTAVNSLDKDVRKRDGPCRQASDKEPRTIGAGGSNQVAKLGTDVVPKGKAILLAPRAIRQWTQWEPSMRPYRHTWVQLGYHPPNLLREGRLYDWNACGGSEV